MNNPFSALTTHPSLVWQLTVRSVAGRYRGANFGLIWAVVTPFLMLIVYSIAFGWVMRGHWPTTQGDAGYTEILFVGLIVHGFFAEALVAAPGLVVGNVNLVKRVVFPLEVLPWPLLLSGLFHTAMNILVLLGLYLVRYGLPPWTFVLLPIVILPLGLVVLGVGWLLGSLGVYFRDIAQMTGVLATAMLFLSTAIVPISSIPEKYQFLFYINPLSYIIDQAREVALWGNMPDWGGLALYAGCALAFAWLSLSWFRATRKGFADVL